MPSIAHHDHRLRLFVAVANARSLREAAETIGMTQPGLSKQIRALEAALGKTLFRRHGRGMQLTADGNTLLLEVEPLLNHLDAVLVRAGARQGTPVQTLRLATVQTLVDSFMPRFCEALLAIHPELAITIHCGSSSNVVESVERDRVDLAFVYDIAVDAPDLVSSPLFDETLALYVRADDDESIALLSDRVRERLIIPPRRYAVRRTIERVFQSALSPFVECDSMELSLRLVAVTDGVTILPAGLPSDMVEDRGLRRLALPAVPPRRLVALARQHQRMSPLFDLAIEIAQRCARDER